MGKKRICSNPFQYTGHSKTVGTHAVTSNLLQSALLLQPPVTLVDDSVLCITCKRDLTRKIDTQATAVALPVSGRSVSASYVPARDTSGELASKSTAQDCGILNVIAPVISTAEQSKRSLLSIIAPSTSRESVEVEHSGLSAGLMLPPSVPKFPVARKSYKSSKEQEIPSTSTSAQLAESEFSLEELSEVESRFERESQVSGSFLDSDVEMEDLNVTMKSLKQTPITKKHRHHPHALSRKFLHTQEALKQKITSISKVPAVLSPKKSCASCTKLTQDLANKFPTCTTKKEKYLNLTCIPSGVSINQVVNRFGCSISQARNASAWKVKFGAFYSPPRNLSGHPLSSEIVGAVIAFYLSEINGKILPGQKDTVMVTNSEGNKERAAKHLLLMTLEELFSEFKMCFPDHEIHLTKFSLLRPRQCVWPGPRGHHTTCTCIIHENFKLLCAVIQMLEKTSYFVSKLLCNPANLCCYFGLCASCPIYSNLEEYFDTLNDDVVEFYQWQSTDRTALVKIQESTSDFQQRFKVYIPKIVLHHFINQQQSQYLTNIQKQIETENSVICNVDFAQNYTFVVQDEVQSGYWNRPQATVHPFVVRWFDKTEQKLLCRSYVVLSDYLRHDTLAFQVYRQKFIHKLKQDLPHINKIYYISDGAAAHYKNHSNLANLMLHRHDFDITSEWHFTATAHGKSTCDAISAVVKRETRLHSLKPHNFITNVDQMFSFCEEKWRSSNTMDAMIIKSDEVINEQEALNDRYEGIAKIKGIRDCHSFVPISDDTLQIRRFSNSSEYETCKFFDTQSESKITADISVGKYAAVILINSYQVGIVTEVSDDFTDVTLSLMSRVGKRNHFLWPAVDNIKQFASRYMLKSLKTPSLTSSSRMTYKLDETEYSELPALEKSKLSELRSGTSPE